MPIYEFKCLSCEKEIEKFCKIGEDGSSFSCPECQGKLKKKLSLFRSSGDGGNGCSTCSSSSCSTC